MITNSLLIIALVLSIVLCMPFVCHKLHIPNIVGLILAGMLIGPSCLGWVENNATIRVLGQIGMLYIMFQSGCEIDLNDFKRYRLHATLLGILSFLLPCLCGLFIGRVVLQFNAVTSLLLGAMLGSHTLMTYPIVSRYGLQKNRAVNITIGATMWAITLSLVVLAVIESNVTPHSRTLTTVGLIVLFLLVVLFLFPVLAQWFFKRIQDPVAEFLMVMLMLVSSAFLADMAGIEGILGAFLCGVALNRRLPNHSPLVGRITFVGNALLVPLFLISVGLMIDVHVFWSGWMTLLITVLLVAGKLIGKSASAWISQALFHFSLHERQLVFGLTHSAAAGTLAIASIGYQMGVFNAEILNAAILMILLLCTLSGFVTEYAAKRVAMQEEASMTGAHEIDSWYLTSVNENLSGKLRELAQIASLKNIELAESSDWKDVNQTIERTTKTVLVYHEHQPLNTINRLLVAVPRYAEKERDFITCFGFVRRLSGEIGAKVVFYANNDTQKALRVMCQRPGKYLLAVFREMDDWEDVLMIAQDIRDNDLPILFSSRKATVSYNALFERIPQMLEQFFLHTGYMVVYPEQQTGGLDADAFLMELPQSNTSWSVISHVKQTIVNLFLPKQKFN